MPKQSLSVPSFLWEDFFKESITDSPEISRYQKMADQGRAIIERTQARIQAVAKSPTATKAQKRVQMAKIVRQGKAEFEQRMNAHTAEVAAEISELQQEIKKAINAASPSAAKETRDRLTAMKPNERTAWLRRLQQAGDWDSLSHVLQKNPAYLDIEPDEFEDFKRAYMHGKHPEEAQKLDMLQKVDQNLRKGFFAASEGFNTYKTHDETAADAAEKALK